MGEFEKHNQFPFAGEKGGFVLECCFGLPGMYHTYFGDLMLQLPRLWFSLPVTGLPASHVAVSMLNSRVTSADTQTLI